MTIYLPALSAFATLRNHAKSLTASVSTVTVVSAGQKTWLIDGFRSLSYRLKTPARIGGGSATNAIYGAQMSASTKTAANVCFQKRRTDGFETLRTMATRSTNVANAAVAAIRAWPSISQNRSLMRDRNSGQWRLDWGVPRWMFC